MKPTKHVQINFTHQPEGVEWSIEKTACGLVAEKGVNIVSRDQADADCLACKKALIADL